MRTFPGGALTADGKQAYVTNLLSNAVTLLDTATNTVTGTIPVGTAPDMILAGTSAVPFAKFNAGLLIAPKLKAFSVTSQFTLSGANNAFSLDTEALTVKLANLDLTVPAGELTQPDSKVGLYLYSGTLNGTKVDLLLTGHNAGPYDPAIVGIGQDLSGLTNPVTVTVSLGSNQGTQSVNPVYVAKVAPVR